MIEPKIVLGSAEPPLGMNSPTILLFLKFFIYVLDSE